MGILKSILNAFKLLWVLLFNSILLAFAYISGLQIYKVILEIKVLGYDYSHAYSLLYIASALYIAMYAIHAKRHVCKFLKKLMDGEPNNA